MSAHGAGPGEVSVFAIESADCDAARRAAERTGGVGKQWTDAAEGGRREARWTDADEWLGAAAEAAKHRVDASVNQWDAVGLSLQVVGAVAGTHVRLLGLAQRVVQAALATARVAMMQVTAEGRASGGWTGAIPGVGDGLAGTLTAVLRSAVTMVGISDALAGHAVGAVGSAGREAVDLAAFEDRRPLVNTTPVEASTLETTQGPVFVAGDLQHAEVVTTFVSGVGSSDEGAMANTRAWALQEVEQARAQGRNVAVIAWHGYEAPTNLAAAAGTYPSRVAARELAEFQRDVRKTNPQAQLNVVGFSYGSVVAGTAAKGERGLEADKLTFLGSPGVGADSADELRLVRHGREQAGEVASTHVTGDLIQLVTGPDGGVHGPDPSFPGFVERAVTGFQPGEAQLGGDGAEDLSRSKGTAGDASSWSAYRWQRLLDYYILARGDHDTHSSYLWDPSVVVTR